MPHLINLFNKAKQYMIKINNAFPPILIYQMGKVGSSTIRTSLAKAKIPNPIVYVHYLSWSSINSVEKFFLDKPDHQIPSHIQFSKIVRQMIDKYMGQIRFKIISLVRDPVARDISSTFQNIELGLPHIVHVDKEQAINDILEYLLNEFHKFDENTDEVCTWFDKEIRDVLKFDVFSVQFNTTEGYQIYSTRYSDILIIRLEDLTRCYKKAFYEFLGISNFSLVYDNKGTKKWYADLYDQTQARIKIPAYYLDKIYSSRFSQHFYTEKELLNFKKRWLNQNSEIFDKNQLKESLNQAENEFQKGNISKSLKILLMIIQKWPNHPLALNDLGVIHWNLGDLDQAIHYLKMAYNHDPFDKKIINNIGRMLTHVSLKDDAINIYVKYLQRYPDDIDIQKLMVR